MKQRKNISFSLLMIIGFSNIAIAQIDINGTGLNNSVVTTGIQNGEKSIIGLDSVRALTEINTTMADAYPYLSPDGLRLYFTQNYSTDNLFVASRSNVNSPFSNQQIVSSNFNQYIRGCWFTNDELGIYYASSNALYYSSRPAIGNAFSTPVAITLTGLSGSFIGGPSLTPDQYKLYIYFNNGVTNYIIELFKTGTLQYAVHDTLSFPAGYVPAPGQLSKDGLKFILGLKYNGDSTKLFQLDRPTTAAAFGNLTVLNNYINDGYFHSGSQPTISADENIMVFVRNNLETWTDNDLYIAIDKIIGISSITDKPNMHIDVFPNPFSSSTTIQLSKPIHSATLSIYDILGKEIKHTENLSGKEIIIQKENMKTGMYFFTIEDRSGFVGNGKFMVE